ncbi:S-adenosyl-L-methionine-dependent methyltransferase [Mycena venus]|uniref:S-adenosyl-L-methionine-dependent methyltransferase n=1 Tax=Mycena venus TaxID=2733690 RepID=A0A8H6XAL6_9AGAR|nr:S-adenosyl-L-methionine-dependent methyltransferase [Mycena venus]
MLSLPPISTPTRQLLTLITRSIETLEASCQSSGTTIPNLHSAFTPPSQAFRSNPGAAEAARIIAAAALQLEAIVSPLQVSLYHIIGGHFKSAALCVCLESGVTEILREARPQGIHVRDIGAKNGQDPEKLARFMRFLATHHIYREVSPNVFANTRISSMFDTLKPSAEILADPEHKHDGTFGLAALASHHLDETCKASAATVRSGDPTAAPFARPIGRPETIWTYYARPDERFRQQRFGIGMGGVRALQPPDAILKAYDWSRLELAAGSLVVDVGEGVGTSCFLLADNFPELKFVVQDLEGVIRQGKELWSTKVPAVISSERVILQMHDFFTPQPQNGAAVFLLKQITHNWSDDIVPFACHDPDAEEGLQEAPALLLANYGATNDMAYNTDLIVRVFFFLIVTSAHGCIFVELLARTGWEFVTVRRQPGDSTFSQCIEAKKTEDSL